MTQSTNNVVEFPKHKIVRDGVVSEELGKMKEKSLKKYADALTEEITENILMDFDNSGINIDSDVFAKDFHFLVGVLTATVYRAMEIEHELHTFIDDRVKIYKDGEQIPETSEFDKLEDLDNPIA